VMMFRGGRRGLRASRAGEQAGQKKDEGRFHGSFIQAGMAYPIIKHKWTLIASPFSPHHW